MESKELDVKRYLRLVYNMRHRFIVTALVIVTVAVVASYTLPKKYEARSTVFIESNVINNLIKDIAVTPSMEERLRVLSYAMSSRNILLKVINDLGVDIDKNDGKALERYVNELQKNTVIRMKDMDLFIVSYKDKDPKFASDYVNTLVRIYIEESLSSKREEAYGANRFLSEQIAFFKDKLDAAEKQVIDFRKDKGIFVSVNEGKIVEEIKTAQDVLEELKIARRELEARKNAINKQLAVEKPYTVAVYGRNSVNERLVSLKKRLNELLIQYTADYPEVVRVQSEIDSLSQTLKNRDHAAVAGSNDGASDAGMAESDVATINPIYQQLKEEASKTEIMLATVAVKEEQYRKQFESKKGYLRSIPEEKTKLADVEMERNTSRAIYEELVAKLGQSEVSKQMEVQDKTATFRIVDPAIVSAEPVSPNRIAIILFGLAGSVAGAFAVVVASDKIDSSVKDIDSLKDFGFSVLAIVPLIERPEELAKTRKKDIIMYAVSGVYLLFVVGLLARELVLRLWWL